MLNKLRQLIQKEGFEKVNDIVLSVPSYFTEQERKALLDACKIADLSVSRLFNESSALALSYGIFRRQELSATAKNVVFIDLGHSKLSAFCAGFTNQKCTVLAEEHARDIGCRNIDWDLLTHFSKKFNEQYDCNPMKNEKAKLRMLDAIERLRKQLSANSEAQISIECLMEDEDLHYNINREELEQLCLPMAHKIRDTLMALKAKLDAKKIAYQDVEIVGGGTRIPFVQKQI